ncbi:MAG: hypothetical protein RR540_06185 [Oscillospiraceae bacterium]
MQEKIIEKVVDDIVEDCKPLKVILISRKFNISNELISFKLCVIVNDVKSVGELEGELYMHTDCSLPFDILLYNKSEWDILIEDEGTFAHKVYQSGVVLYE